MTDTSLKPATNPFGESQQKDPSTDAIAVSQSQAAVQGAVVMAKQFPRNELEASARILRACQRPSLAAEALYAYPKGGQTVSGPSIRLAEVAAQQWGNMDFGMVELSQQGGTSQVMAYAWDLETNVRSQKVFVVSHSMQTRKGTKILRDPREIYEHVANQGSRRVRACIMAIIPKDVMDSAVNQVQLTLADNMEAPKDEIEKMVKAFEAEFDVTEDQIRARLGKNLDAITAAEVLRFRSIYASLRDGMSSVEDWFDPAAKKADQVRAKLKARA